MDSTKPRHRPSVKQPRELTAILDDLLDEMDSRFGHGTVIVTMDKAGYWVVECAHSCDPKARCVDKKDADDIAANANGLRAMLEVAREWIKCYENCPIEGFKMTVSDIVRAMIAPFCQQWNVPMEVE